MLWNFDFLERIIGLNLENNRKTFQEVQNRIFGKILSTIASSLRTDRKSPSDCSNPSAYALRRGLIIIIATIIPFAQSCMLAMKWTLNLFWHWPHPKIKSIHVVRNSCQLELHVCTNACAMARFLSFRSNTDTIGQSTSPLTLLEFLYIAAVHVCMHSMPYT